MKASHAGFTLIELLIAVAIIGILLAIAVPSYSAYLAKSARAQAKTALLDVAQMEERYFSNNSSYIDFTAPGGAKAPPAGWNNYAGNDLGSRKYDISVAAGPSGDIATSYAITAQPANGFSDSTCGNLTVNSSGSKASSVAGSVCW